jgi:hypothetical protein
VFFIEERNKTICISAFSPVSQNGLDFARPPDLGFLYGGEEYAAAPPIPPLPKNQNYRTPSEVEVSRPFCSTGIIADNHIKQ